MENFQSNSNQATSFSPSSLLCKETHFFFDEEGVDKYTSSMDEFDDVDEEDYVKMLFHKEISCADEDQIEEDSSPPQQLQSGRSNWIKDARLDAIQYILNITTVFGFKLLTAYISITYLDTFLSRRHIDGEKSWAIKLVAVACISLAAKMEECTVPSLLEFALEEYNFESRVIQRMELFILSTLEWKMLTITPFSFIHFFLPKLCNDSPSKNIWPRIFELIFRLVKDVNLISHKQSVVAATMTLMALDPRLSKESVEDRLHGLSSCLPLNIEEVWSCYKKLQGLDTERVNKSSKCIISPPLSPTQFPNPNALGNPSSSTPAVGSKRKRLGFNECDQHSDNFPPKDETRRQT